MVSDKQYCGLGSDHYVICSNVTLNVPGEGIIQLGIRPDDLSLYINDSRSGKKANARVEVSYEVGMDQLVVKEPIPASTHFPAYSVIATRNILAGDEIMWNYLCKTPDYISQIEPFGESHKAQAQRCSQLILGKKLQFVASPMDFDEGRRLAALPSSPLRMVLSPFEQQIRKRLEGANKMMIAKVLEEGEKQKKSLCGYLKFNLKVSQILSLHWVICGLLSAGMAKETVS